MEAPLVFGGSDAEASPEMPVEVALVSKTGCGGRLAFRPGDSSAKEAHGSPVFGAAGPSSSALVARSTCGETVLDRRRSPAPEKPLFTIQPVSFPRRRMNWRARRRDIKANATRR